MAFNAAGAASGAAAGAALGPVGAVAGGLLGGFMGGGGDEAAALPPPPQETNVTRGDKTVTFNNGFRLKDVQPLLIVAAVGVSVVFLVKALRQK